MNSLTRFVAVAASFGVAACFTGCVQQTTRAPRVKVVEEFAVVESSTNKELTSEQLADLRKAVTAYLQEQGLTDGRTYYVRVSFPADNPDEQPQWAVVRIGSHPARTYTVLAAYPGADDYYPYDIYRPGYGYSNYFANYYPYAGFSNWGYYDPFDYNYGAYHRPVPPRDHAKPVDPKKPDDPSNQPTRNPGPRNRWDTPPKKTDGQSGGTEPTPRQPQRWNRDRPETPSPSPYTAPRPDRSYSPPERYSAPAPDRSYSPPPAPSYTPPPAPSYSPPASDSGSRSSTAPVSVQQSREQER
jgi:hypothetical protein